MSSSSQSTSKFGLVPSLPTEVHFLDSGGCDARDIWGVSSLSGSAEMGTSDMLDRELLPPEESREDCSVGDGMGGFSGPIAEVVMFEVRWR